MKVLKILIIVIAIMAALGLIGYLAYFMAINFGIKCEDLQLSDNTIIFFAMIGERL